MRIALISLPIEEGKPEKNLQKAKKLLFEAMKREPHLVCFPEMSIVNDAYPHGMFRHMAEPIPGKYSELFCKWAEKNHVHIVVGLLKRELDHFYSSAILIDTHGDILLKQRQVRNWPPYACGKQYFTHKTDFGTVLIALCADIWDEKLFSCVLKNSPDHIIIPADMSGEDDELGRIDDNNPPRGIEDLKARYLQLSTLVGSNVLAVNAYCRDDKEYPGAFGGAFMFCNGREFFPSDLKPDWWRQPLIKPIYYFEISERD